MSTGQLVFDVAQAKALALSGDVGLVAYDGEEVIVDVVDGRLVVEPAGILPDRTPLIRRVERLLGVVPTSVEGDPA